MPKQTAKYVAAVASAKAAGLVPGVDADGTYRILAAAGYQWDSDSGKWIKLLDQPADAPTDLVRIRVWANGEHVQQIAQDLADAMYHEYLYELIEQSEPYPCRPPKQKESRVYLTLRKSK